MNVYGKTALISGASKESDRAISLELARKSIQRFVLGERDREQLAEEASEVNALVRQASPRSLDLTRLADVDIGVATDWRN